MSILKISSVVGAIVTLCAAGYFMFAHYASSQETTKRSKSTKEIVIELKEIHLKQDTADEARVRLLTELCLSGKIKDRDDCAKVGVKIDEPITE
jgi:hypothetical protein